MCDVSSVINWCKMNSSPERQQLIKLLQENGSMIRLKKSNLPQSGKDELIIHCGNDLLRSLTINDWLKRCQFLKQYFFKILKFSFAGYITKSLTLYNTEGQMKFSNTQSRINEFHCKIRSWRRKFANELKNSSSWFLTYVAK